VLTFNVAPVVAVAPPINIVVPFQVRLASSSNAPDVPAIVIRLSVKSLTIAEANVASPDVVSVVIPVQAPLVNEAVPSVTVPAVSVPDNVKSVAPVIAPPLIEIVPSVIVPPVTVPADVTLPADNVFVAVAYVSSASS